MNRHDAFGELRSVLQGPNPSASVLLDLIKTVIKTNKHEFQTVWGPYLHGFKLPEFVLAGRYEVFEILPYLPPNVPCVINLTFAKLYDECFFRFLTLMASHTGIRRLNLSNNPDLSNRALYELARAKHFIHLECVEFSDTAIDHHGVVRLLSSEHLPALCELEITHGRGRYGREALTAILQTPLLGQIHTLKWWSDDLGAEGAHMIAHCDALQHLEVLWIWANSIGDDGLTSIANSPYFDHLKDLRIQNNAIGNRGMRALNQSALIQHLHILELGSNHIEDVALLAFIDALQTSSLRQLDLCELCTPEVLMQLAHSPQLSQLTSLDVNDCELYDVDAAPLFEPQTTFQPTTLNLELNHFTDKTLIALANAPHMHALQVLNLADNAIGDAGAQALARSPYLHNLTNVDMSINQISDQGAMALAQSPHLTSLDEFVLYRNAFSQSGEDALKQSPYFKKDIELWL